MMLARGFDPHRYPVEGGVDVERMSKARLAQLQETIRAHNLAGCLFFDPINIRYATEVAPHPVRGFRRFEHCVFVPPEGGCTLFQPRQFGTLSHGKGGRAHPTVATWHPAFALEHASGGHEVPNQSTAFARLLQDVMRQHDGGLRLGVDRGNMPLFRALTEAGIVIEDGMRIAELARAVKTPDEIAAIRVALRACEAALITMEARIVPGITENALWAHLHQEMIAAGGEWIETRLLTSGQRTRPWLQETSFKPIQTGDMVSYDTDVIGPYGYEADISRSLICNAKPSGAQRTVFALAREQLEHNMNLLRPGLRYKEFSEKAYVLPDRYVKNRYAGIAHGIGLAVEAPYICYPIDAEGKQDDGVYVPGMVVCIESLICDTHDVEAVKLEEQVLITEDGFERLSQFPFSPALGG
ncbi:MAG: Xaa-Pro peptidase family protein [Alphaproteobacteria bacterium]|nr:Xaa-Pro peptidase family protein [Alphaproteobacteria bacterium]